MRVVLITIFWAVEKAETSVDVHNAVGELGVGSPVVEGVSAILVDKNSPRDIVADH